MAPQRLKAAEMPSKRRRNRPRKASEEAPASILVHDQQLAIQHRPHARGERHQRVHGALHLAHLLHLSGVHVERLYGWREDHAQPGGQGQHVEAIEAGHEAEHNAIQRAEEVAHENDAPDAQPSFQVLHQEELHQQLVQAVQEEDRSHVPHGGTETGLRAKSFLYSKL